MYVHKINGINNVVCTYTYSINNAVCTYINGINNVVCTYVQTAGKYAT